MVEIAQGQATIRLAIGTLIANILVIVLVQYIETFSFRPLKDSKYCTVTVFVRVKGKIDVKYA